MPFKWQLDDVTRYIRRQFCDCSAGQAKEAVYKAEVAHEEWQQQAETLVTHLSVGLYSQFRFGNWDQDRNGSHAARVFETVREYVGQVQERGQNWLYLCGGYGLGKTLSPPRFGGQRDKTVNST